VDRYAAAADAVKKNRDAFNIDQRLSNAPRAGCTARGAESEKLDKTGEKNEI
jgi:hypothetical protein